MNVPRFFCAVPLCPGLVFELPAAAARHAVRVLRLSSGAPLTLFDGRGGEYPATIERIRQEKVQVCLERWRQTERESRLRITLVQAIQAADKMDYTIQKAVELGVAAILPVASQRSVVRLSGERQQKRLAHWQSIAIAACEQCGRNRVPEISPVHVLETWLHAHGKAWPGAKWILTPGAAPFGTQAPVDERITLLVGAEGGLTKEEASAAQQAGFVPVGLGPRVLRTETAALAALSVTQALWGDFREGTTHV